MSKRSVVNVVTADRGWILEKLATELANRLSYVKYTSVPDASADVRYYVTYATWKKRSAKIEVAYFAHLENDPNTRDAFFNVAREVNYCVCHSKRYEDVIRDAGVEHVTTIPPGVDLQRFKPKVKIGVVGRTYHTGRKGEGLVAQVMDVPGIEWHFTGTGWPGPARHVPDELLPDFYNSLDYVLVPALYEGGPMCVAEALACGTPVIAPPIGWVNEFPHIEFQTGSAEDLRRVLMQVVAERNVLREAALGRTWDNWADGHDRLFRQLMRQSGLVPADVPTKPTRKISVALVMHGSEKSSLGGPTVRVPRTAEELRRRDHQAAAVHFPDPALKSVDLVHGYNVWSPKSALTLARSVKNNNKPFVFSPIFLDLSDNHLWGQQIPRVLGGTQNVDDIDVKLQHLVAEHYRAKSKRPVVAEAMPGYHSMVREMISLADQVILLSEHERKCLEAIGAHPKNGTVVHNPVDSERFGSGDPTHFTSKFGIKDFVLCVARIEPRKNQLLLLHALRKTGLPIVLIGQSSNPAYLDTLKRYCGPQVHLLGRIDPASDLIAGAYAAARVAVLPSWCEGAPLAALEAGASGAPLVLSDQSSEQEYFGDLARYCNPADPASIRDAVLEAYETPMDETERSDRKALIARKFSWERHAEETLKVYDLALRNPVSVRIEERVSLVAEAEVRVSPIIIDVTTSAEHKGRWTGICRVETALAHAMLNKYPNQVAFSAWRNDVREFVSVPPEVLNPDQLGAYVRGQSDSIAQVGGLKTGSRWIVAGSAWMQNSRYARAVAKLTVKHDLCLTLLIHDLIPVEFPFWFAAGYSDVFRENLALLLSVSQKVIAISENTKRDVERFAMQRGIPLLQVDVLTEGADHVSGDSDDIDTQRVDAIVSRPFVLAVGAIHSRKNYRLLYDVWVKLSGELGARCPRLVIVGGVAWNGGDVARWFKEDARIAHLVDILENVDDSELHRLYEACLFTVYPSLYEGWGLPVVESLKIGKICIASNTSSVPEIAPACTDLLDPTDTIAWTARIGFYATSRTARESREAEIKRLFVPRLWPQTAEELHGLLNRSATRTKAWPYVLGTPVLLSDQIAAVHFLDEGWHDAEKWGAWTAHERATLRFRIGRTRLEGAMLVFNGRALGSTRKPIVCDVFVQGKSVGVCTFRMSSIDLFALRISEPIDCADGIVSVEFNVRSLVRVSEVTTAPNDTRLVGIGIESVALCSPEGQFQSENYRSVRQKNPMVGSAHQEFVDLLTKKLSAGILDHGAKRDIAWGAYSPSEDPLRIFLNVVDSPATDLLVQVERRAVAAANAQAEILVHANGELVGRISVSDDNVRLDTIRIPSELRYRRQPIEFEFVGLRRSPAELGIGINRDRFPVGVRSISVVAAPAPPALPTLSTVQPYAWNSVIDPQAFRELAVEGTWIVTSQSIVCMDRVALFGLTPKMLPQSDVLMRLCGTVRGVAPGLTATVSVKLKGREVARETWSDEESIVTLVTSIPKGEFREQTAAVFEVYLIPNGEAKGVDSYALFAISSLQLEPLPAGAFESAVKLGDACRDLQLWEKAIPYYADAIRLRPNAGGIQVQLANMLKECGRHAEAEQCYIAALQSLPKDPDVLFQLGHLMNKSANYPKAHAYYSRALRLFPQSADIAHHVVWAEQQLRRLGLPVPAEYLTGRAEANKMVATGDAHAEREEWALAAECYSYALSLGAAGIKTQRKFENACRKINRPILAEQFNSSRPRWNLQALSSGMTKLGFGNLRP